MSRWPKGRRGALPLKFRGCEGTLQSQPQCMSRNNEDSNFQTAAEMTSLKPRIAAVTLFAIAMGYLEAAVVVYLRLHYYPDGFVFPLVVMPQSIVIVEVAREVATVIMLGVIGWVSGKDFLARFSYFSIAFGVWDIFYYIFLKAILDWPASLFTDDILFLIPLPWVAPVLAPVLVSLCLIVAGIAVLIRESRGRPVRISRVRWLLICLGGTLVLASFLVNADAAMHQQPLASFSWYLFTGGMLLGLTSFGSGLR